MRLAQVGVTTERSRRPDRPARKADHHTSPSCILCLLAVFALMEGHLMDQ